MEKESKEKDQLLDEFDHLLIEITQGEENKIQKINQLKNQNIKLNKEIKKLKEKNKELNNKLKV